MFPITLADWAGYDVMRIVREFLNRDDYPNDEDVLFDPNIVGYEMLLAYYAIEGYEGSAFVLLRKDDRLYEINASHCSCRGLENNWEPEEVTKEALLHRIGSGRLGRDYEDNNTFAAELLAVLDII
jgi:hypothetical protein